MKGRGNFAITLRPLEEPRADLIRESNRGGITLVLGAGISVARRLPNWNSLAHDLWREAFPRRKSPWDAAAEAKSPREVPQFLPIVFELAYAELGAQKFLEALREKLYQKARFPLKDRKFSKSHETLAVLARLIVQEFRLGRDRRIDSIISFNADDMLEQAACALVGGFSWKLGEEVVRIVARPTHAALRGDRFRPIPIYHIHGFVPSNIASNYRALHGGQGRAFTDSSDYMLVFTDVQYWSTSATALAFANRVMLSALSESRCVFIGLSMTDINLLRWLALRTLERDRDLSELRGFGEERPPTAFQVESQKRMFNRHFWIRPASDDPTGFLSEFLAVRGIRSVELKNWTGLEFQRLIQKCFPKRTKRIRPKK